MRRGTTTAGLAARRLVAMVLIAFAVTMAFAPWLQAVEQTSSIQPASVGFDGRYLAGLALGVLGLGLLFGRPRLGWLRRG